MADAIADDDVTPYESGTDDQVDHVFPHRAHFTGDRLDGPASVADVMMWTLIMAAVSCIGVIPVYLTRHELSGRFIGLSSSISTGVMIAASYSLINEVRADVYLHMIAGIFLGTGFMLQCENFLESREQVSFLNLRGVSARKVALLVITMAVHSAGEGAGVGVAFASRVSGMEQGLLVALAIGFHNIPEAAVTCMGLLSQGAPVATAASWAILCNFTQVLAAVPAFVGAQVYEPLHPVAIGFAAACMLYMAMADIVPDALRHTDAKSFAVACTSSVALFELFRFMLDWATHHFAAASAMTTALVMSFVAGGSTGIGGAMVAFARLSDDRSMAFLFGLAGGVMITISILDLTLPALKRHAASSVTMWFLVGGVVFAALNYFLNDKVIDRLMLGLVERQDSRSSAVSSHADQGDSSPSKLAAGQRHNSATGVPPSELADMNGSSHVFVDTTTAAERQTHEDTLDPTSTLLQRSHDEYRQSHSPHDRQQPHRAQHAVLRTHAGKAKLRTAAIATLALAAHNAPEGLAVGLSSVVDSEGLSHVWLMVAAMAIHNIPEGIAIAAALREATVSAEAAAIIATLSGMVEPISAVLSVAWMRNSLSESTLELILVAVGGLMTAVSLTELIPQAIRNSRNAALAGIAAGFGIMWLGLYLVDYAQ